MKSLKDSIAQARTQAIVLIVVSVISLVALLFVAFDMLKYGETTTAFVLFAAAVLSFVITLMTPLALISLANVSEAIVDHLDPEYKADSKEVKAVNYAKVFKDQDSTPGNTIKFIAPWIVKKVNSLFPCPDDERPTRNIYLVKILNGMLVDFKKIPAPKLSEENAELCKKIVEDYKNETGNNADYYFVTAIKIIVSEITR